MRARLLRLTAFVVSLLVAFLIAEGALRLLSSRSLHVFDVEMWRYARLVKIESDDPKIVEEHRPDADEVLMGVRVRTDEHGFRLPDPSLQAERRTDDRQVLALGDSVTFGWGAGDNETFPAQLERLLNATCPARGGRRATVHNAGIGNCNTSMEVARYRERIRSMHPDWVIVGYSYNDAEPDAVPSHNPLLWRSSLLSLLWARTARLSGPYRSYEPYYKGLYHDGLPGWEGVKRGLRELGTMLREDHIPGTLILLPELHEPKNFGPFAGIFAEVAAVARANGFEVIDPSGAFPPGPGESFWVSREDAHPNVRGQKIYAEALLRSRHACVR
ncbi:MAG TPA: SGNH/GDSL hydrolase family protein [Thermoanaerobaculia bacterium]|nr:SGNH/GDSL hydrolase family protein [Thermoanaerobaculia bacterium]